MPLDQQDRERLSRLLGMFGSTYDGEVLNAARAAEKLIRNRGETWESVIVQKQEPQSRSCQEKPQPNKTNGFSHHAEVDACLARANFCTQWEQEFLVSIKERWSLSDKQRSILNRIKEKIKQYDGMDW